MSEPPSQRRLDRSGTTGGETPGATPSARLGTERLPQATVWRFAYLLLEGGLSLLLFSLLSHILPAKTFAPVAVSLGVLTVAQALGDLGLAQAAVSVVPRRLAETPGDQPLILASAATAFYLAAGSAFLVTLVIAALVPAHDRLAVALIAPATASAVVVSGADGLLRAVGEFRRSVLLVTLSRVGSFAAIAVAAGAGANLTLAVLSGGTVLASAPAVGQLLRWARPGRHPGVRAFLMDSMPIGLSQLFIVGAGRVDTLLLTGLASTGVAAGFEGVWRLYQLALYASGGLTAVTPFLADALGREDSGVIGLLRRISVMVAAAGVLGTAVLYAAKRPISDILFGHLGAQVSGTIAPLIAVFPLAFLGVLATVTHTSSRSGRRLILWANAGGAVANLGLIFVLAPNHGLQGGVDAVAAGVTVTQIALLVPFLRLLLGQTLPPSREAVLASEAVTSQETVGSAGPVGL